MQKNQSYQHLISFGETQIKDQAKTCETGVKAGGRQ